MKQKRTIVPGTRLVFWTGTAIVPFAGLAALAPALALAACAVAGGLLALAVLDIWISRHLLGRVRVQAPDVVRLSLGRKNEMRLLVHTGAASPMSVHIGLPPRPEFRIDPPGQWIHLDPESENLPVVWPVVALKQGRYALERCVLETRSRMGFWMMRGSCRLDTEIRVYPSLWEDRKQMAAYFSRQGVGVHLHRQVGKGREFDQLREYQPGDSYEDIHWKATAKRRQPITRVYRVERTQQIYLIVDASRLSARKTDIFTQKPVTASKTPFTATLLDRFITAALLIGMAAERQGDRFGLFVFDDSMRVFLQARTGGFHFKTCRESLSTLSPKRVSPDFSELFTYVGTHVRRRAMMIFLTSLDDPVLAESFTDHIEIISRRHLVLVQMMKPKLAKPVFSDPQVNATDDLYHQLGGHFLWARLRETTRVLQRMGVRMALADNADFCPSLLSRYLAVKQRQIL